MSETSHRATRSLKLERTYKAVGGRNKIPRENMPSSQRDAVLLPLLLLGSAAGGAALLHAWQKVTTKRKRNPETDHSVARRLVWDSITGSMNAAMLYTGDKLGLYRTLLEMCVEPSSSVTAVDVARETGYSRRWIREWLAQQAAMGILLLLPGSGDDDASLRYRLPRASANVLANPDSSEYDIAMVQLVPALVNRARTMLPEAFSSGIGRPYDEPDVAEAIDRHHTAAVRDRFIPKVLPRALDGQVQRALEKGCKVSDLGCGAGILLVSLARRFPNSEFHGFEVSKVAIEKAAHNIASSRLSNVFIHDANEPGESLGDQRETFDVAFVYDVLHDCTDPVELIRQLKVSLKPELGVLILGDIPSAPTVRENIASLAAPATYYGFSVCLCMSCALSEKGGAGLGTLGFTVPVANKMLKDGGFKTVEVISEDANVRWFQVQ